MPVKYIGLSAREVNISSRGEHESSLAKNRVLAATQAKTKQGEGAMPTKNMARFGELKCL